jgi:hypothetical protein
MADSLSVTSVATATRGVNPGPAPKAGDFKSGTALTSLAGSITSNPFVIYHVHYGQTILSINIT